MNPQQSIPPYLAQVARRTVLCFLTLLGVLAVCVVAFFMFFDLFGYATRTASEKSGREITLVNGAIDWGWTPKLVLEGLNVGNIEGSTEPSVFKAERIVASLDIKRLLKTGETFLPEVTLTKPDVYLEKNAEGKGNWNFKDEAAAEAVTPDDRTDIPAIGRLAIEDGRLRYKDASAKKKTEIDAKISTVTGTAQQHGGLKLEGGGSYQDGPFKLIFNGGSVDELQDHDTPYPLEARVIIGNTQADIAGTVMDPIQLKGLDLKLQLKGASAADLFPIIGIALPPTPPYRLLGQLGYEKVSDETGIWKFSDFAGTMGGSDLGGNLTWDTTKKRPLFTARFLSKKLDFKDLGGLIGAPPADKAVDPKQKQQAAKREDSPYILPDAKLDISRLKAMDADVEFTGKQVIATALPLDDFFMKVMLDNLLLKVQPVKFGTAGGDIVANLEVNARTEPPVITSDFQFRRLSLTRLFEGLSEKIGEPNLAKGYIGGTAKLKGSGKSLKEMFGTANGSIGIGMEGGQLSNLIMEFAGLDIAESLGFLLSKDKPTRVRCVIGDFKVTEGVAKSNAIVVDTADTNILGEGTLNLKSEEMNITLEPHPKDPSFLSLRAPIHVNGTLKKPQVGVDVAALAARGTVAAVLSVALTPIGALLGFIEPGLGKDSDCAGLLTEMDQANKKAGGTKLVPKNAGAPTSAENTKAAKEAAGDKADKAGKRNAEDSREPVADTAAPGMTFTAPVRPRR